MRPILPIALVVVVAASLARPAAGQTLVFSDGFEFGDTCLWSSTVGSTGSCVPPAVTVTDIQTGGVSGPVALSGVILTARSADGRQYWIADDPFAAPWQGVYVDRGSGASPLGAEFAPGAVVDLTGYAIEYDPVPPGDTLTEVLSGDPMLTGTDVVIPLAGLPLSVLGSIDEGEPLEGVVVEIADVSVVAVDTGDRLTLSDGSGILEMDDAAFDYSAATYPVGTCFATVVGVSHLDPVADRRQILPRGAADLVLGGGCLP